MTTIKGIATIRKIVSRFGIVIGIASPNEIECILTDLAAEICLLP